MKRIVNLLLAASLLAGMSGIAYAEQEGSVVANVPFAFSVQGKTLPAGAYSVRRLNAQNTDLLVLSNVDGSKTLAILTGLNSFGAGSSMVFHRYGDEYFLSSIRTVSGEHVLSESKAEQKLARETGYEAVTVGGSR